MHAHQFIYIWIYKCINSYTHIYTHVKVHVHLHTYALYTHMCVHVYIHIYTWLPKWLIGKESTFQAIDLSLIPELGRFPGEGNGNPLQYPCLGNPMNRGALGVIVHGVEKSWMQLKWLTHKKPIIKINSENNRKYFVFVFVIIWVSFLTEFRKTDNLLSALLLIL